MSEPKFTKGPLTIIEERVPGYARRIFVVDATTLAVCEVTGGGSLNPKVLEVVRANAHLFAAGPALYEALKATGIETEQPCEFNGDGNCQAHSLEPKGKCYVELGLKALKLAEGKS